MNRAIRRVRRFAPTLSVGLGMLIPWLPATNMGPDPAQAQTSREAAAEPSAGATTAEQGAVTPQFSTDIAPVLVGNCIGCHNPREKARRNNLDLTTFGALLAGGESGPAVVAGKPGESPLLLRVKGQGVPKMPPGNRDLAPETIDRIERWIASGARLDAGKDPAAEISKYAPTPEEMRRAELAGLGADELDERVRGAGLDRWKAASAEPPEVIPSGRFMLFSQLPSRRAEAILKAMNSQQTALRGLLGPAGEKPLGGPAKLSLFVFNDPVAFAEFVRSIEHREIEAGTEAVGNFGAEMPYLAALDPRRGAEEAESRGATKAPTGERSLPGLLSEQLGAEVVRQAGDPPRWLSLGLGAYLAQRTEPNSPYYAQLRRDAFEIVTRGGLTRAQELLGGEGDVTQIRALGFGMLEWLGASYRSAFTPFVRAMLSDGAKFDDVIRQGFGAQRDQFLKAWGSWVMARYGRRR